MALQQSLLSPTASGALERRFLSLFLPTWPTDYLKRHNPTLTAPLALYEKIKGGLRLVAMDAEASTRKLRIGQSLADARAIEPLLLTQELDRALLEDAFADFADWHSNASPLVAVMTDMAPYGDLVLDITGVAHLFGGEGPMLRLLLTRLRLLGYTVTGAVAPTIGAAWATSHFIGNRIVSAQQLLALLDALPVAALRLSEAQLATLGQMGLKSVGQLRQRPRKSLQARFGASLLIRIDQAYGLIAERMTPRLPLIDYHVEQRFAEPISRIDDVLAGTQDLAMQLAELLEAAGKGAQAFHLYLYRVDHKMMSLSVNAARLTRDASHIAQLFMHRAERLAGEYDAGFGIDMIRLAASSIDGLDASQLGAFVAQDGAADVDQLNDRMASRLGPIAVLRNALVASHLPERAARLVPAQIFAEALPLPPKRTRPLRLLPVPERVLINAEVPDGLPASMIWRRDRYRLVKAAGPERLEAEWWRNDNRLELVPQTEPKPAKPGEDPDPVPYKPELELYAAEPQTRDYYRVEDEEGRSFWVFRLGFYGGEIMPTWYLHGFFS